MRARAPAPPTVWLFGVFSIVPLFIAAWVYCYGPLNLRVAGLLGLLGYVRSRELAMTALAPLPA